MSTTTDTGVLGEELPEDTTTGVLPETGEQQEHEHEDGEVSPMCSGNGCVQKTASN